MASRTSVKISLAAPKLRVSAMTSECPFRNTRTRTQKHARAHASTHTHTHAHAHAHAHTHTHTCENQPDPIRRVRVAGVLREHARVVPERSAQPRLIPKRTRRWLPAHALARMVHPTLGTPWEAVVACAERAADARYDRATRRAAPRTLRASRDSCGLVVVGARRCSARCRAPRAHTCLRGHA